MGGYMKRSGYIRVLIAMCIGIFMVAALGGCTAHDTQAAQQQSQNRQYMMQVNQIMEDFKSQLNDFTDVVSKDDVVGMRTKADSAFKIIADFEKLEAPAELQDVKQAYLDGMQELKDALSAYIDLYTEIGAATEEKPFDWKTYDERLAKIDKQYNEGMEQLKAGDDSALSKS